MKLVDRDKRIATFTYDEEFTLKAPPAKGVIDPDKM